MKLRTFINAWKNHGINQALIWNNVYSKKKCDPVIKILDWAWGELSFPLDSAVRSSLTLSRSLCLRSLSAKTGDFPPPCFENKCVGNGGAPRSRGNGDHRVNVNCKDHQESRTAIIVRTLWLAQLQSLVTQNLPNGNEVFFCLTVFNLTYN